jgi:hypothetical protein
MWNHCQGLGGRRCRGVELRWRKNINFTQVLYSSCIMEFIIRGKKRIITKKSILKIYQSDNKIGAIANDEVDDLDEVENPGIILL